MFQWLEDLIRPVIRVIAPTNERYVAVDPSVGNIALRRRAHVEGVSAANVGLLVTTEHVISQASILWGVSSVQTAGASTGTNWYVDLSYDASYSSPFQLYPNNVSGSMTGPMGQCLTTNIFPLVVPGGSRIRMRSAVAAGAYTFRNSIMLTEI